MQTAKQFTDQLKKYQSPKELEKIQRYFKSGKGEYGEGDKFIGVKMGDVFKLAKEFMDLSAGEIEKLLESPFHEIRAGAVSIMDYQARNKKSAASLKKEIFELYLRRHDRINNWDLVDRAAPYVIGGYLADKPKTILTRLAKSKSMWERRTAITATYFFIRQGEVDETFRIAKILCNDPEDLVQKSVGGGLRWQVKKNLCSYLSFLKLMLQKCRESCCAMQSNI